MLIVLLQVFVMILEIAIILEWERLLMIIKIKKHKKFLFMLIVLIIMILLYNSSLMMLNLPTGDYINSVDSPTGKYTIKSYRYSGGATMDWTLRVELVNNETNKKKNIYWVYHEDNANMKWIDEKTVEINGIQLNIFKDVYDWRKNR